MFSVFISTISSGNVTILAQTIPIELVLFGKIEHVSKKSLLLFFICCPPTVIIIISYLYVKSCNHFTV